MLITKDTAEYLNTRKDKSDISQLPQGPPQLWYRLTGRRGRPVREVGGGVAAGGVEMAAGGAGAARGGGNADVACWP